MSPVFGGVSSFAFLRTATFITRQSCRKLSSSQIGEAMKLYSDPGNPSLLRILAAKNLADVSMTIQYITNEDRTKFNLQGSSKLPVLETDDGNLLHSPNSICRYLLDLNRSSDVASDPYGKAIVDQWVEWESTSLQPVIFNYLVKSIGQGRDCSGHVDDLVNLLRHADEALASKKYFSGSHLGLADVIIWGSLHPLFMEGTKYSDPGISNLKRWHNLLMSQELFLKTEFEVAGGKEVSSFKDALLAMLDAQEQLAKSSPSSQRDQEGDSATEEGTVAKVLSREEIDDAFEHWNNGSKNRPKTRRLVDPILPIEGERNILITSALPYVNNVPHLGNIIGCVLSADVFARYFNLQAARL